MEILNQLRKCNSRIEATNLLIGFKKVELINIAKESGCFVSASENKDKIIERIVRLEVGLRLESQAIASALLWK